MSLLLDSSVLIAAERGDDLLEKLVDDHDGVVAISIITVAEYWKGIEVASGRERKKKRQDFYDEIISVLEVLNVDERVARTVARLWASLRRQGTMIPDFDLLIAATAVSREMRLATLDVRHFDKVSELDLLPLEA